MKALPIAMAIVALAFATSISAQQLNTKNTKQLGKLGQVNGQPTGQGATPGSGDTGAAAGSANAQSTMADLVSRGYEIKAAVPNGGGKFIVFMQKDKSAYACEFSSLSGARCGSIN
jgi:hypothetical protein